MFNVHPFFRFQIEDRFIECLVKPPSIEGVLERVSSLGLTPGQVIFTQNLFHVQSLENRDGIPVYDYSHIKPMNLVLEGKTAYKVLNSLWKFKYDTRAYMQGCTLFEYEDNQLYFTFATDSDTAYLVDLDKGPGNQFVKAITEPALKRYDHDLCTVIFDRGKFLDPNIELAETTLDYIIAHGISYVTDLVQRNLVKQGIGAMDESSVYIPELDARAYYNKETGGYSIRNVQLF